MRYNIKCVKLVTDNAGVAQCRCGSTGAREIVTFCFPARATNFSPIMFLRCFRHLDSSHRNWPFDLAQDGELVERSWICCRYAAAFNGI
jgi:hypothetical protein